MTPLSQGVIAPRSSVADTHEMEDTEAAEVPMVASRTKRPRVDRPVSTEPQPNRAAHGTSSSLKADSTVLLGDGQFVLIMRCNFQVT